MRRTSGARAVAVGAVVLLAVVSAIAVGATNAASPRAAGPVAAVAPTAVTPAALDLTWTNLSLANAAQPPPRVTGSMVYDSELGEVVLFGGQYFNGTTDATDFYNDTWTFAHGVWTNVTTTVAPSPRSGAGLAYDPANNEVVLFGGRGAARNDLNDTWTWTDGTWTNISATVGPSPPPGFWFSMAYDAQTEAILLFGGVNVTDGVQETYTNATWSFIGNQWTHLSPATVPPGRQTQAMVWDTVDGEMVMFGGQGSVETLNDTWTYYDADWNQDTNPVHPGARGGEGIAFDSSINRVVLYGGTPAPDDFYSTWLYVGGTWTQYNTSLVPNNPQATYGQFVYDAAANEVVDLNEPLGEGPVSTWVLTITNAPIGPSSFSVTLTANPASIALGAESNLTADVSGGTSPFHYSYSGLPAGCTTENTPTLPCTPTAAGSFRITVTATDDLGNTTQGNATLTVTSSSGASAPSSSGVGDWVWILVAVVVVVVVLVVLVVARRRRPSPPAPPGAPPFNGPPVPPPPPPGS